VNAGGGWSNNGGIDNVVPSTFCAPGLAAGTCPALSNALATAVQSSRFGTDPKGFIGGGQIGYNLQIDQIVLGVETDFQGSTIRGGASFANIAACCAIVTVHPVTAAGTGNQRLDWLGTLRGRVGWLPVNPLLIYATGGLAYGHVEADTSFYGSVANVAGTTPGTGFTTVSDSSTRAGWTVGGGLEWKIATHWTIKGEYLYYNLGSVNLNQTTLPLIFSGPPTLFLAAGGIQSQAHYSGSIARAGVNYLF
jgi:outer membrane immunogenic protein